MKSGFLPARAGDMPAQADKGEHLPVIVKICGSIFEMTKTDALRLVGEIVATLEVMEDDGK